MLMLGGLTGDAEAGPGSHYAVRLNLLDAIDPPGAGQTYYLHFTYESGADNLIAGYGRPSTPPIISVYGSVWDAYSDKPISGAQVVLDGVGTTITDSRGEYLFLNVLPGTYSYTVSAEGYFVTVHGLRRQ